MGRKRTLRNTISHQRRMIDALAEILADTHKECPEVAFEDEFYDGYDEKTHKRICPDYCSIRTTYDPYLDEYCTDCDGDATECWKKFISERVK